MIQKRVRYAFIDSQNLNMSVSDNVMHCGHKIYTGWKLDFKNIHKQKNSQSNR